MVMNLVEFVRQNNINCIEGEQFSHSPEFFKIRQFEQTCHTIHGAPFLEPETCEVKEFDVVLKGSVQEKWDRKEKTTRRRFLVERMFRYPGMPEGLEEIEDTMSAGETIEEAVAALEAERQRFEFFKRYDLMDTGRYWLNRDLKRCAVDDGQVVVIDRRRFTDAR
jgi:hypothetical protein